MRFASTVAASVVDVLPTGIWQLSPYAAIVGILVFLTLGVARGWVIPRASHERELAVSNKRGDEWKETAKAFEKVNVELLKQNGQMLSAGLAVIVANPTKTEPSGGGS